MQGGTRQALMELYTKFMTLERFNRDQVKVLRNTPDSEEIRLVCQGAELAYGHAAKMIQEAIHAAGQKGSIIHQVRGLYDRLFTLKEFNGDQALVLRDLLGGRRISFVSQGSELGYGVAAKDIQSLIPAQTDVRAAA